MRIKNTLFSPFMVVSVLLGLLFLLRGKVLSVISYNCRYNAHLSFKDVGDMFLQDIHTAHVISGYDVFAPIFAVLPSATIFCDDFNSGYIKWILNRSSRKRYIKEIMLCSSVGGSLAIFLPSLLSCSSAPADLAAASRSASPTTTSAT